MNYSKTVIFIGKCLTLGIHPVRPNESNNDAERSGVYFDPRYANHIHVGFENKVLKSTDVGANFKVAYSFPNATGLIYEMEISRINPNVKTQLKVNINI